MYGYNGDMFMEDLIPEEEVVTITAAATLSAPAVISTVASTVVVGIMGAPLRGDDVVEHFRPLRTAGFCSSRTWVA